MSFETKCDHIVWSREYSIKGFLSAYGKKLPQVVKVTQGFHGDYFVDSISNDEILRVHKHSQQKRVIGQDSYGSPLSVPVDFALPLQLVVDNQSASPPCTLKAMLTTMELPFKVRLSNVTPMTGDKEDFGVFRLESEFEQRHLLVNCVLVDELEPRVRMVPSSLTAVRLVVAKGFDDKNMDWKKFLSQLNEVADTLDYNGISGGSVRLAYNLKSTTDVLKFKLNRILQVVATNRILRMGLNDIAMYATEALHRGKVPCENLVPNKLFSGQPGSVRKTSTTNLAMPEMGLLSAKHMASGGLSKSPSSAANSRGILSGHCERPVFPVAQGHSDCHPLPKNCSASPGMDRHGSEEQEEWDSGEEGYDCPPPPLHRTIRDKPHPDRLARELPEEPFVYSFRRKLSTPETTSSPPPGLPPRGATKPGARPRSSSESDGLPGSRLSVGIWPELGSRTSSSSHGVGVPERSPSIDPPSGPPPRVAPKPRSRLRSSPEPEELPEGRPSLDLRPEPSFRMSSSSQGVGVAERTATIDLPSGPPPRVAPKPRSRLRSSPEAEELSSGRPSLDLGPELSCRTSSSSQGVGVAERTATIDISPGPPPSVSPKPDFRLCYSPEPKGFPEKTFLSKANKVPPRVAPKPKPVSSALSSSGPESTNQISTWQEVPSDLASLSVDQVTQCLQLLKLDRATIELFRQKELDGAFLTLLSEDKLREFLENDTSLSVIDKEKIVKFVKHKWRPI